MFIVIGVFCLTLLLGTITYAFFNYTRTVGASGTSPTTMNTVTVRPAIYIDSNALITSGTGLIDSPYEITI